VDFNENELNKLFQTAIDKSEEDQLENILHAVRVIAKTLIEFDKELRTHFNDREQVSELIYEANCQWWTKILGGGGAST